MVSITIREVLKTFGAVRAVDSVSLEIAKGELFFLLGPSGCGKTTLLRVLAGFYRPDAGRILFGNNDVTDVPPHKRNTGMVFQNYALWPHMTVRGNLEFGLEMRGVTPALRRERAEKALDMVQMLPYVDRSPNQLSAGQQQRVALARALVLEPDVVLMDEPLANLDAKLRLEMREQIANIHSKLRLTMVYVTHDQAEALSMASRIAVMKGGRIVQVGAPQELYARPADPFVADFIGEANLVKGRIVAVGQSVSVETPVGPLNSTVAYEGAKAGDAVQCAIRPERLRLVAAGEVRQSVLEGELVRSVYLGDHRQHFVRLKGGTMVKAIEYRPEAQAPAPGTPIRLSCETADVVLLREG
jgi:iron(III) transport system ATP-binding protein